MAVFEFIADFQTLISAAVGFAGVVWSIRQNGKQSILAREAELRHRSASIKSAIRAELNTLAHSLKDSIGRLEEPGTGELLVPQQKMDQVFQSITSEIPTLEENDVAVILDMYGSYASYYDSLYLFSNGVRHNYLVVQSSNAQYLKKMTESIVNKAEKAVVTLSKMEATPLTPPTR